MKCIILPEVLGHPSKSIFLGIALGRLHPGPTWLWTNVQSLESHKWTNYCGRACKLQTQPKRGLLRWCRAKTVIQGFSSNISDLTNVPLEEWSKITITTLLNLARTVVANVTQLIWNGMSLNFTSIWRQMCKYFWQCTWYGKCRNQFTVLITLNLENQIDISDIV